MIMINCCEYEGRGEELKVPHHASAAAARDGNLPYTIATCLYSQQINPLLNISFKYFYSTRSLF